MEKTEFDANEVIAGFPLASIKRALAWVGVMEDRDDIKNVAKALRCPPGQAERVLEALERRGLVSKTARKRQWETTALGHRLKYYWQTPRKIEPAIEREAERGAINQVFDSVPCSILRTSSDEGAAFEEADLQVGVFVEYETDRLIEISLSQPDDYDHRDESGKIESTVHVGLDEAKRLATALQKSIEHAERELVRRKTAKQRRPSMRKTDRFKLVKKPASSSGARPSARLATARTPARRDRSLRAEAAVAAAKAKAEEAKLKREKKLEEARLKREKDTLARTLREVGVKP
jgi:hypothetical protein